MTPGEFREFAKAMREFGIKSLTLNGAVIELFHVEQSALTSSEKVEKPALTSSKSELLGGMPNTEKDPIQHKVEQVASLMRLNDMELVDSLFPEPKQDTEVSVNGLLS